MSALTIALRSLHVLSLAIILLTVPTLVVAADNQELQQLVLADQADRTTTDPRTGARQIDWPSVRPRDILRREQVLQILRSGDLRSARDYYNAALVFQHGDSVGDIELAHGLATVASSIDPGLPNVMFMVAATWDRICVLKKIPQWYGTQYTKTPDGRYALYPTDANLVSDVDRNKMGLPSLAEAKVYAVQLNDRDGIK